jgi:hypothetical protein
MTRAMSAVVVACALALAMTAANAGPRQQQSVDARCDNNGRCVAATGPTGSVFGAGGRPAARQPATGGRPSGCPPLWCGCGLALKLFGKHVRELWPARAWLKCPHVSGPVRGSIAVLSRGRRGGHVGIVRGVDANGNPIIFSGNHNRRWGTATYPRRRVIAYVRP